MFVGDDGLYIWFIDIWETGVEGLVRGMRMFAIISFEVWIFYCGFRGRESVVEVEVKLFVLLII